MENSIVYHGSNVEVSIPRILQNGFYKDFGYGFYCTSYEKRKRSITECLMYCSNP